MLYRLVLLSLAAFVLGKPVERSLEVHESRATVPPGFTLIGPAPAQTVLNLRLALTSSDTDGLIKTLYDVSTPSSANYGQHLSKEETEQFLAPTQESLMAVNEWLAENDINATTINSAGNWLAISVPVSQANDMFDADFSIFTYSGSKQQSIRTLSYSIPSNLKGHLDLVHPTVTFTTPVPKLPVQTKKYNMTIGPSILAESSACENGYVDPACLQALYGIPTTPATESSNYLVVTGYNDQYPSSSDLEARNLFLLFLENWRTDISSSTTYTVVELDGGEYDPSDPGDEANLDTQYTVGLATNVPVTFFSVGEDATDDVFGWLDTANYFLDETNPPSVITTSYNADEDVLSVSVANNLCNAYAALGARGVSVLFSSGDGGVSGIRAASCTDFVPTFPSGCPYLTSVGATQDFSPETAASFSSGGFSNYFSQPSFQSSAVETYLEYLGNTNAGLYNASGRAYPDVSAQGVNFIVAYQGKLVTMYGTSCSSPTFASIISLVNDRLVAAGQSTLGWLNPFLYSTGLSAFTDITSGDNPGCNTNGFSATTGWDPVTGLGTPIFANLLTAVGL
ncbi:uncharacterized protein FIBRA_05152 [Fibroporia radiculosa]|uniref:tripeptidyl-peptidase II n=1 Tax=Fibroporia radiculosa TaxID=599839 RepID=J4GQH1_9APHY|nr:uncharacterized protein FIBRA_05152 [Fibroporia radiculosa]CCM03035.1 predicted protein [Fibroporia radiculosa]